MYGDRRQLIFRHIDKVRCRRAARRQLPQTNVEETCARGLGIGGGPEPVEDDGGDGNSPFARAFLKALSNNTDVIDGTRLFAGNPDAKQTPEYSDVRVWGTTAAIFYSCASHNAQEERLTLCRSRRRVI